MTKLTRRGALGLFGGAAGLAGCESLADKQANKLFDGTVAFDHGVASGDPLTDRVVLWTRVTPSSDEAVWVSWQVFENEALSELIKGGAIRTSASRDFTVKVDAEGLQPGRDYYYVFSVMTVAGEVVSPVGRTRTAAASGNRPVRAAVVSCSNFPFGHFNVYKEIAKQGDLDAVIHLGDYLYEYGPDGYGGETGEALGRPHDPPHEIVSLADYRRRHAQYKSDDALQAAHAAAPWICTWDDHESANNSYRTGAENHDPSEGDWTTRKQRAVQAYLEWMPVRDPAPGMAREALWRTFDFGDVATIACLESRLTGRSQEISWSTELRDIPPDQMGAKAGEVLTRVNDVTRTMLGSEQEDWLSETLAKSVETGKAWQVLANQVIMAEVRLPDFNEALTPAQIAAAVEAAGENGAVVKTIVGFSALGLPQNLDAWDGFPAARERLYTAASEAGATLVTLTGDTHTAWANTLIDAGQSTRGIEFGCTSVTSPGLGRYLTGVEGVGALFSDTNPQVNWFDPDGNGYTLVTFTESEVSASFHKVSTVETRRYSVTEEAAFVYTKEAGLMQV